MKEEESLSHVPQSALPPAKQSVEQEFEKFWQAYPFKKKRGYALKAFRIARKSATVEVMLDALARTKWREDAEMNPNPETWLLAECWLDVQPAEMPKSAAPRLAPDELEGMDAVHMARWKRAQSNGFPPCRGDGLDRDWPPGRRREELIEELSRVAPNVYQKVCSVSV